MPNNEFEKKLHFNVRNVFMPNFCFCLQNLVPIKFTPIKVLFTMHVVITNNITV